MSNTFVVTPLAAWYTVWNEGRFGGNAQLDPAELFGGIQPLVTQASTLNAAVDKVVSGNLNGSSTVLAQWRDDPDSVQWISYWPNPTTMRMVSIYSEKKVKSVVNVVNGGSPQIMVEWQIQAVG